MQRQVALFGAEGGTVKGSDGHRRDTMAMVESLRAKGWPAGPILYGDDERVVGFPHPDAMTGARAEDAPGKLVGTGLVSPGTTASCAVEDFTIRNPAGQRR